jgi:hypothetical protein
MMNNISGNIFLIIDYFLYIITNINNKKYGKKIIRY